MKSTKRSVKKQKNKKSDSTEFKDFWAQQQKRVVSESETQINKTRHEILLLDFFNQC